MLTFRRRILVVLVCAGLGLAGTHWNRPLQAQEPDPATLLYVKGMGVSYTNVGGPRRLPVAVVDVVDGNGQPVNDALVVGDWSGCFKQKNDSDLTQTVCWTDYDGTLICVDGRAEIWADKSYSCWGSKQKCYFTFSITGVFKNGMTYVPVIGYGTSWSWTQCD
jgi:hypothetical protein